MTGGWFQWFQGHRANSGLDWHTTYRCSRIPRFSSSQDPSGAVFFDRFDQQPGLWGLGFSDLKGFSWELINQNGEFRRSMGFYGDFKEIYGVQQKIEHSHGILWFLWGLNQQYQQSSIWGSPNWGGWLNPNGFFSLPNFIKQHGFLRLFKMTKTFQKFSLGSFQTFSGLF
jgi:hypothetical protein